jgi:hypothetical protein
MTSKGIIFFAVALTSAGALAVPQEQARVASPARPKDGLTEMVRQMKEPLGLTQEQMAKAELILQRRAEQAAAERAKAKGNREEMLRRIDAVNRQAKQDIDALLTEPQRVKLEEIRRTGRKARAESKQGQETQPPQ